MNVDPLLPSLRALTRNLPNNGDASSCSGDGVPPARNDGSSAMRTRSGRVLRFGEVTLPASKSESNRALMIAAYGDFAPDFQNLSDSNDTKVLRKALDSLPFMSFQRGIARRRESIKGEPQIIDIADCGTAARFMTTYLACHHGDWILTGTERMKQRPIKPLVDALISLGADIQYVESEGSLPLHIHGKPLQGGQASVDMTQSSQFASSLLLAAPMFPQGLVLELLGCANSLPYLDMTIAMMCHFSAQAERRDSIVVVKPQPYQKQLFTVEPDWTAASYWYEMAAFSEECEIKLRGLSGPSALRGASGTTGTGTATFQGDAIIVGWMKSLGVCTTPYDNGLILTKKPFERKPLSFDFTNNPDLYPTMAATCAGLNVEATFTGLDNLALKESDRVEAMQKELEKLGGKNFIKEEYKIEWIKDSTE